ncbi:hypothetical protein K32_34540 [Kaistia sp. 32K]|uniref:MliC family protein n=1 Tax=Kaistia sp. 32K TaxID=2795690 RepID=UPI001934EC78|nr:MliC family protein [Kaistia sp. 32K]BCP54837.1 hypothetical protein K32_34540 [Kaistia sp. 32K]
MQFHHRGVVLGLGFASMFVAVDAASAADFDYRCEDGTALTATFSPPSPEGSTAQLVFADGRTLVLPQVVSADGGRYQKDDVEFWIKGKGAMLTVAGKLTNCTTAD